MNKTLFSAVLLVFLLSVVWILNDFGVISLPFHSKNTSVAQNVGKVEKKVKNVQRRGKNSLAWDEISQEEDVFNNDSLITLSNSQASIKMNDGVGLSMDENTLVTILAPLDQFDALTLNLMAGSYKISLNKGKKLKVHGVVFSATEDSHLLFKADKDSQTRVTVASGAVDIVGGKNTDKGKAGQEITIDNPRGIVKPPEPIAKAEPAKVLPPKVVPPKVALPKVGSAKRKVAEMKPKIKPKTAKKIISHSTHKASKAIDEPSKGEVMDKRHDPESMSQELEELPGN